MAEELLDRADIVAILKQMRREAVPKGMATGRLGNSRLADGLNAFLGVGHRVGEGRLTAPRTIMFIEEL